MSQQADLIVLGAGASGLMVSQAVASTGAKVICLEKNPRPGRKILVSGGGRCNYTNLQSSPDHFLSSTRRFCYSALRGYPAPEAGEWFKSLGVKPVEKKKGQLFCQDGAKYFLSALVGIAEEAGTEIISDAEVFRVEDCSEGFKVSTNGLDYYSKNVVVATGGLSWPKLGVSDVGYRIAEQYGHAITDLIPGLVPFRLKVDEIWSPEIKGISLPARVSVGKVFYEDDLLMTHFGISGPVILQISNHMSPKSNLRIDLLPGINVVDWVREKKEGGFRGELKTLLGEKLPSRLADCLSSRFGRKKVAELKKEEIKKMGLLLNQWTPTVLADMGYDKAEVTLGGVSCEEVSSKTMESQKREGLYFIGEVLDVTGELGGFNFQWAWSSAMACARGIRGSLLR